ncbi:MAG: putative Plasmid stabilization system [Candidatus Parcubacteria bacterium]|jgi:plasmid stabilization system protein ParE
MKLLITEKAYQDLENIRNYIGKDNVEKAQEVARKILIHTNNQLAVPAHGKRELMPNTFELVVPRLPYVVVYRITNDAYEILHIFHDMQYRGRKIK